MNKNILNTNQRITLDFLLQKSFIGEYFWFSGGTALAQYYLHHRLSDDLDFFTNHPVDTTPIDALFSEMKQQHAITQWTRYKVYHRNLYELIFPNHEKLKLEFTQYNSPLLPLEKHGLLFVESQYDLMINKIACIIDRYDPKDLFDIYYLRKDETHIDITRYLRDYEKKFGNHISPQTFSYQLFQGTKIKLLPHILDKTLSIHTIHTFYQNIVDTIRTIDSPFI